jgi:membrane carboxypeptidase/penicillin-binding protein
MSSLGSDASQYGLSLVLGSGEISLLEMTNGYAVFANQGIYHTPYAISSIKNKYGKAVTDQEQTGLSAFLNMFNIFSIITPQNLREERIVIDDSTAFLISSILSDNNARTEVFGNALTISRPAAVKTGTTNDYRDALTIGYTPGLVIGVWVGNNDNTPMDNVAGSLGAAPIWRLLMERFLAGTILQPFIQPSSIVKVLPCSFAFEPTPSHGMPIASISAIEYFIRGTEPAACPTPTPNPTASPSDTPTPSPTNEPTEIPTETPIPTDIPTPTIFIPITPIPTL